ncbi:MAG: hypothetical protein WCL25_04735, partial [bacterium]
MQRKLPGGGLFADRRAGLRQSLLFQRKVLAVYEKKHMWLRKSIFLKNRIAAVAFSITVFFSFLFPWRYAYGSVGVGQERRSKISKLSLSEDTYLPALNDYLLTLNLLDYFAVRKKLLLLPYEELSALKKRSEGMGRTEALSYLIGDLLNLKEEENMYLLQEKIFVNNRPSSAIEDRGRIRLGGKHPNISSFDLHDEYFYFNRPKFSYKENALLLMGDSWWVNSRKGEVIRKKTQPQAREGLSFDPGAATFSAAARWPYILA